MPQYSQEFREACLKKMMPPENRSISEIAKETGVTETTLYNWRKESRSEGTATPGDGRIPDKWSSEDKFLIVLESASLNETELAEYCRRRGLFVEQVQEWKDACMHACDDLARDKRALRKEIRDERQRVRELERDLRRKEKALAETSALLVLRKTAHAIWGDGEDA